MKWTRSFTVVGCHAEGEVGNVVTGGMIPLQGDTVFEMRRDLAENHDDFRKLVLFEPRGAAAQNANVIVPAKHPDAQFGFIIMESTEYPVMSGSNTMCVATVLLETGMAPMTEPVTHLTLEAPAGLIPVVCACQDGHVVSVRLTNQPSFPYHLDQKLDVPGIGALTVDIAYGGMTFVLVDAAQLGVDPTAENGRHVCELGARIIAAAAETFETVHPENPDIPGITIATISGPLEKTETGLRCQSGTVVLPGRYDRSPCGTATCARMSVLHDKGLMRPGDVFEHISPIGSRFFGRIEGVTTIGGRSAVIPSVEGRAWTTYVSQHGLDPSDPFPEGYTVGDTWLTE